MAKKHDILWLDTVDSTNEEARRRISDIDNLSVLSALEQTAGRGQRGNGWSSRRGENLIFSIVLKNPEVPAREQFVINEITSLSVTDFLAMHGISARIKWPNDIYVGSKKICGILIENSIRGNKITSSIIGIGLNINQRNFDVNLINPTSMALCHESDDTVFDIRSCLEEFMDIFRHNLDKKYRREELREAYHSYLWRLNETHPFIDRTCLPAGHMTGPVNPITKDKYPSEIIAGGRIFTGTIRKVSDIGTLIVEDAETGHNIEFGFKDIAYIL